jgi:hypothetical protein
MKKYTILSALIISILTSVIICQSLPHTINYQGVVKDASGVVVANGDYTLKFTIYEGDVAIWTETKSITVTDGIVNTMLGSITPIDLPFDNEYYLGITVGTESELTPRTKLNSVPYSFMSMNVPDGSITASKISNNQVVKSINSIRDNVNLVAGSNVSISPNGNNLIISSTGSTGFALPYAGSVTQDTGFALSILSNGSSCIKGEGINGVIGYTNSESNYGYGLIGRSPNTTQEHTGVLGTSNSIIGTGVSGLVYQSTGTPIGVKGETRSSTGYSGYFIGGKFYTDSKVGIGTTNPSSFLEIEGNSSMNFPHLELTESDDYARIMFRNSTAPTKNWTIAASPFSTDAQSRIYFYYNNGTTGSNLVSIFGNGNIGIGTETPGYKLDITGTVNFNKGITSGIAFRCNGDEALWYNGTYFSWGYAGSYNFFGNKLKIGGNGNAAPEYTLYVDGTAAKSSAGTTWIVSSDQRLKDILGNYNKGLNEIVALQPVKFRYKENNPRNLPTENEEVGFVAQEVQKIFPEAVSEAEDGYLDFNIHSINVALVNAVKELKAENDELKARLEKVEKYLNSLSVK